ncbi:MAG: DNA polymerase III subunit gamma/tau [Oscillospiraceae bacterium]|nr:DNA polymerase III subunit gamma/tau [Oscillospiraceae bacterium]
MYQALYRKYRPQTFDEVVGQSGVTQTLKRQLVTGKTSHAYLFTGSRGTGKTSCAKILAKAINCENPQNGNPCNACPACRSIDAGACLDVQEIDAASNNGVDQVRTLRDDAIYTPAEVKNRVYIIDEVHMLSISAFNALLKIIEEPPEHLLFILATTELHKVPATIVSRCQRFSFRRLTPEDIAGRINFAAYQEQIEIEADAVRLLSRLADGALRDGLSLLDQCASAAQESVTTQTVAEVLGLAGAKQTAAMLGAVAARDAAAALKLFEQLYAGGKDVAAMLDELCSLARDLLILKTAPKSGVSMMTGVATDAEASALLGQFSAGELLRITTLLQQTMAGFSKSVNRRTDAELCLLQLCTPQLQLDAAALGARLAHLEEQAALGTFAAPKAAAKPAPPAQDDVPPPWDDGDLPAQDDLPAQPASEPAAPVGFWTDVCAKVVQEVGAQVNMYLGSASGALQGDTLTISVTNPILLRQMQKDKLDDVFRDKAAALLGKPIKVVLAGSAAAGTVGSAGSLDDLVAFGNRHTGIVKID